MQKIKPCLWFDGNAEEAMTFYMAVFKDSQLVHAIRCGEAGPGPQGALLGATFRLAGQEIMVLNGGPQFHFTPAISLFVTCETQAEIDDYWDKLLAGGKPQQCGWLTDRYGVSWQIVPRVLGELLQGKDAAKSQRAMRAMMQMIKLDIATLQKAYDGR